MKEQKKDEEEEEMVRGKLFNLRKYNNNIKGGPYKKAKKDRTLVTHPKEYDGAFILLIGTMIVGKNIKIMK